MATLWFRLGNCHPVSTGNGPIWPRGSASALHLGYCRCRLTCASHTPLLAPAVETLRAEPFHDRSARGAVACVALLSRHASQSLARGTRGPQPWRCLANHGGP